MNIVSSSRVSLIVIGCLLLTSLSVSAEECQVTNPALQAMKDIELEITSLDDQLKPINLTVKLADNNATRGAGFQSVCESAIKDKPILFVFDREFKPRFHMNNVVASLDIAFIDKQGRIVSIQTMKPYILGQKNKPLYQPPVPAIAALEAYDGYFANHKVTLNSKITWQLDAVSP